MGELIRRHESLRTTFAGDTGSARQVIAPAADASQLPFENVSAAVDPVVVQRVPVRRELPDTIPPAKGGLGDAEKGSGRM